jgi:protein-disulfide isomerase
MRILAVCALAVAALAAPPAGADDAVTLKSLVGMATGKPGAPVVVIEFTDLECPDCQRFHRESFARLKQEYVDTGKVLFVSRDLPLPQHEHAVAAAHAARCAGDQGRYWALRHIFLARNDPLSPEFIQVAARLLHLDMAEFGDCQEDGRHLAEITRDMADAKAVGAVGTPTFVIGRLTPRGVEGTLLKGVPPWPTLEERLRALLEAK